jgi:hypothetical protein
MRKASRSKGGGKPPHSKRVRAKEFGLARFAGVSPGYQTMWVGRREKAIQELVLWKGGTSVPP